MGDDAEVVCIRRCNEERNGWRREILGGKRLLHLIGWRHVTSALQYMFTSYSGSSIFINYIHRPSILQEINSTLYKMRSKHAEYVLFEQDNTKFRHEAKATGFE